MAGTTPPGSAAHASREPVSLGIQQWPTGNRNVAAAWARDRGSVDEPGRMGPADRLGAAMTPSLW
jgi:hypothetical protein